MLSLTRETVTTRTRREAATHYQKACDCDEPRGCDAVANLVARGAGVTKEASRAKDLRERACKLGLTQDCKK